MPPLALDEMAVSVKEEGGQLFAEIRRVGAVKHFQPTGTFTRVFAVLVGPAESEADALALGEAQQQSSDNTPVRPALGAPRSQPNKNSFGKEGVAFIQSFLAKTDEGEEDAVTPVDVARLRLLSCAINKAGNDQVAIGAHDANLLFTQRKNLSFGGREPKRTLAVVSQGHEAD